MGGIKGNRCFFQTCLKIRKTLKYKRYLKERDRGGADGLGKGKNTSEMPFLYIPYISKGERGDGDSVREIAGYRKFLHYADMLFQKSRTYKIHG